MADVTIRVPVDARAEAVLTEEALGFIVELHRRFNPIRLRLLRRRLERQNAFDSGEFPDFLPETEWIREGGWEVRPPPQDLSDRRVEITGPTDAKMIINALDSGARVFMADFEDANSPTWHNMVVGQLNLVDAVRGTISHEEGRKSYRLKSDPATLMVRPRGWHLDEPRITVDGERISASLFDAGLYLFHNARVLLDRDSGPYFYLPKLESHHEARLWNEVFRFAQDHLGIPYGSVRATVLIETITAAFEMEEILYELRDHSAGLNAGRWDYVFSIIKKFRAHPTFLLPDRSQVAMHVPFMHAYTDLLVRTCHRRQAHAIGGMSAFIPSRRQPEINERAIPTVREDKQREVDQGFDGAWVAHPDLVPLVKEIFDEVLGDDPYQIDRSRDDVDVSASDLLDVTVPGGEITEAGLLTNVSVSIRYLDSWLRGSGAAALFNLMEDTATAEISRSQIWQWIRHRARTSEGVKVDRGLVHAVVDEELRRIQASLENQETPSKRLDDARRLFEQLSLSETFDDFLTLSGMAFLHD